MWLGRIVGISASAAVLLVVAGLVGGCAPAPNTTTAPTGSPIAAGSPGPSISSSRIPVATTSPSPRPSTRASDSIESPGPPSVPPPSIMPPPSATVTPAASPSPSSPVDLGAFVIPAPPDAATAWAGLTWRKLAPTDPLAHVQSMIRRRGGFAAVGDLAASGETAHSRVWVSADGATWSQLGADVFGPSTIVVGMAPTADGIAALTLQAGKNVGGGDPNPVGSWTLTGPLQSWTSLDGTTWAVSPGPDVALPEELTGESGDPTLLVGTANHVLVVMSGGRPVARSVDGIAWEAVPAGSFPAGWTAEAAVGIERGFLAVGGTATRELILSSSDGRAWASKLLSTKDIGNERLVAGSAGQIATGLEYLGNGAGKWTWWSSPDGRSWRTLSKYPPLGPMLGQDAQECRDACPDGILVGNGERMLAYGGHGRQAGWTSFDGRSWQRLVFAGGRPTSEPGLSDPQSVILLPAGVVLHDLDGSTWFGAPLP
jgi:hypothetical protein